MGPIERLRSAKKVRFLLGEGDIDLLKSNGIGGNGAGRGRRLGLLDRRGINFGPRPRPLLPSQLRAVKRLRIAFARRQ